jgi:GNAT superfamily N-acetyltransferase
MALVATREPEGSDDVIGVARYALTGSSEEAKAELAIVVEDAYQNRGLGRLLLARLAAYARAHGITAFAATVLSQNTRVFHLITRSGLPAERHSRMRGEVEVSIPLTRGPAGEEPSVGVPAK